MSEEARIEAAKAKRLRKAEAWRAQLAAQPDAHEPRERRPHVEGAFEGNAWHKWKSTKAGKRWLRIREHWAQRAVERMREAKARREAREAA